jgi:hypothetical protein
MELVFEPDLETGEEAAALVKELMLILQRLGTCSCKMEGKWVAAVCIIFRFVDVGSHRTDSILTARNRVLREKLVVPQLVEKLICILWRFITTLTRACHLTLP